MSLLYNLRTGRDAVADLREIAKTATKCAKSGQDCLYWCFGTCSHGHNICEFVSRTKRGIGPALGAN